MESRREDLFQADQRLGNTLDWGEYTGRTHIYLEDGGAHDRGLHDIAN